MNMATEYFGNMETLKGFDRAIDQELPEGWKSRDYPDRYQVVAIQVEDHFYFYRFHQVHLDKLKPENYLSIELEKYDRDQSLWVELHIYIDKPCYAPVKQVVGDVHKLAHDWLYYSRV